MRCFFYLVLQHNTYLCLLDLFNLFLTIVSLGFSQNQFTLSGTIYETEGQETLIGATIIFPELNTGTTTNEYGFYSITLEAGTYEVLVSYMGFESIKPNHIIE